ncbi:Purine permease [Exophiala dermatitidis]
MRPRRTLADRANSLRKIFCTRNGLLGNYDYAFLFRPNVPFLKRPRRASPFFGLDDPMPVVLAILLGFQHAMAMLAGVMTPPIILAGQGGANLAAEHQQYLVSTALIVSGILSAVQITRFNLFKSPYYLGTGLISVVGTSFSIIPVAQGGFSQMYANGYCPVDSNGNKLPCPEGYGALIGTCALCALIEMAIAFLPPKALQRVFPPVVTGPTVMMIGVHLIQSGFQDWAGGSGTCNTLPDDGFYRLCPNIDAPHALRWGSAEFIGLGFLVFLTIILCERFGSPIMKSTSVIIGLLVGCIVAAACGYFDDSGIKSAPVVSFVWVKTFPLSLYGPLVLPVLTFFIICACETIGDVTATCDVSRLEVEGPQFESRIQGGILADGLNGILAALMTITPMSTFAQNNGVIALTRCANRTAGYCCCMFLFIMGLFTKFSAALVAIPSAVLGGMTTFLYCAVAVSGMAIVNRVPFNRRTRFILTASLAVGYGSTLVPTWFDNVFTYDGGNHALQGFYNAIILVMETGFTITAFIAMVLNLVLPEDLEDELEEDSLSKRSDCSSSVDEASKVQDQPSKEVV